MSRSIPLLAFSWALLSGHWLLSADKASFSRDIRPILAAHCFACHGPDDQSREADLRLDTPEGAAADLGGHAAIVPGALADSELWRRITSDDPDEMMPPPAAQKPLEAAQIELLRRWIQQGAEYDEHWAFVPPRRPSLPLPAETAWVRNPIDHFVLARLHEKGWNPSPEADRYTLVRRLFLDLIGLPPTVGQADAFVQNEDPQAYERLVDQLLNSEHYGERWARPWLDLARYADTNGYEKDRPRSIWPYRDWVIQALNQDLPFDQFTIEQLAGDMLPNATVQQRIATGFHRNTMLNEEGGIDPLEFRFYAMVDRVATTGLVWMGLTTGCAQCHSHKYDPISHQEYYQLMALLNNADEPDLLAPTPEMLQQRRQLEQQIDALRQKLPEAFPLAAETGPGDESQRRQHHLETEFQKWLQDQRKGLARWIVWRPTRMETNLPKLDLLPDGSIFSRGDITKRDVFRLTLATRDLAQAAGLDGDASLRISALRLEVLPDERLPAGGPGRAYYEGRKGDFFLSEVSVRQGSDSLSLGDASHSYGKISIGSGTADAANVLDGDGSTGWSTSEGEGRPHQLVLNFKDPQPLRGELDVELLFERHFAASLGRFRLSATVDPGTWTASALPVDLESLVLRPESELAPPERQRLLDRFLPTTPLLSEARKEIEQLQQKMPDPPTTMVMQERQADNPRPTHRHHRGEYLSPKEEVRPAVPAIFPPLPADDPVNRLTFARWLVSRQNPLAARVTVNRAWRAFFGQGLVATSGDFGTQSEPPTHPQLLDWLAVELMDQGWSMKRLHRLIVTSATYRQDSTSTAERAEADPDNRWLARGPRFRVEAEMVRDIMLQSSGLLAGEVGGPSVFPPQPASVAALAYGDFPWQTRDPYRRSLYTFSKRTAPFAAYLVFDGPTGEECVPRRDRSNTPLQALTLLNDEMFVAMAQHAAQSALPETSNADAPANEADTTTLLFRRFLTRPPNSKELEDLLAFRARQRQRLLRQELDSERIGGPQADAELASWVMVARVIMNLDEAITKQ